MFNVNKFVKGPIFFRMCSISNLPYFLAGWRQLKLFWSLKNSCGRILFISVLIICIYTLLNLQIWRTDALNIKGGDMINYVYSPRPPAKSVQSFPVSHPCHGDWHVPASVFLQSTVQPLLPRVYYQPNCHGRLENTITCLWKSPIHIITMFCLKWLTHLPLHKMTTI